MTQQQFRDAQKQQIKQQHEIKRSFQPPMHAITEAERCRECGIYVPQLPNDFLADAQIHLARQIHNIPIRAWLDAFGILAHCREQL